jgi:SAM-dependent methyltransferase
VLDILRQTIHITPDMVVADIGSGTGFSSELFLSSGRTVYGVEPNREMREAGEGLLKNAPRFISVEGTAEATTLEESSVDLVVAGQAFHWFDIERTRKEFSRILKPDGWVLLMWNTRRTDSTAFLKAYEELLREFGTDYMKVRHDTVGEETVKRFFLHGFDRYILYNEQVLDFEGLKGRLLSSSYVPAAGQARHDAMLERLQRIFDEHRHNERVVVEYDTEIFVGRSPG